MTTKPTGPVHEFERSTRMPLDAVVRLHFEGTVAYQNGFAANVSASGMYVKHPDPPPVATRLVFEFTVGSQRKPVQGVGEVIWSRDKYDGPGRPAGAGIRFVDLDELSRQHIAEAIFEFLEASLGDRVAEHPEARALVASVPTHAPPDFGVADEPFEREPDPASLRTQAIPAFTRTVSQPLPLPSSALEPEPAMTPFRIFDDEPGPAVPTVSPAVLVPPELGERTPVARPSPPPMPPAPLAGAAAARTQPRGSKALGVVLGLLLAGIAGGAVWWFYLRPQSVTAAAATPSGAAPAAAPVRPSPRPLDPKPGPGRTLVESVGRSPAAPETQIPPPTEEPAAASAEAVAPPAATSPPAAPAAVPATAVESIRAEPTASGATVTIAANGGFAEGAFVWSELGGDRPRVLIKLRGMRQPFRGTPAGLPTAALQGVRVGYHAGNEVHVVLDLPADGRVRVEAVEPAGRALVVRLARS